jgi:uncharacterized protein (TIGR02271 family)
MATTTEQRSTVVGVFEDRRQADTAIRELRQAGFREDQIGVAGRQAEGETPEATTAEPGTHWETGAVTGALAGAGLGGLVGLGIIAGIIPAIGPVIAGGTLAAILANVAGGAALGGLVGALVGAGIPEEEARYYQSELEAGRTLVTVKADGRYDEASSILHRHGAYDMHTAASRTTGTAARGQAAPRDGATGVEAITHEQIAKRAFEIWQQRGCPPGTEQENWLEAERQFATGAATAAPASRTAEGGERIQVREEELQAHKQPVETGEVRVRKEAVTEHRTMEVPVQREEVVIERQAPTGEQPAASDIGPGEEIRVPVSAEQVTMERQPVVKEEVTVGKRAVQDTERVGGEVRKEQVRVEREGDVDVREGWTGEKK